MKLSPGAKLRGYDIIAPIAEGGMGTVWRARDAKLGRQVAIKVVKTEDPSGRLLREARTAARLNHPNIVTVHEVGESDGAVYVVMELVDGRHLGERIPRSGMSLADALRYAIPIARGLEAAHKLGIVHRDLKPANLMVSPDGFVKLLDFGLAKEVAQVTGQASDVETKTALLETEEGKIVGTIAYMSPEQAQAKQVDGRTDIFSFGTLLYEMLTGRRPFDREDKVSTLSAILREEPEPIDRGLPEAAERLVMRCLRKDPDRRFQTGADLRAALEELKDESELSAGLPRIVPQRRTRRAILAAIAAIVSITVVVIWVHWWRAPAKLLSAPVQITFDGGFAATPSLSSDGNLFAFASDRAEPGNLDIWLRPLAGGTPIRLTSRAGIEFNPQFSSDGTRLYYLTGDGEIEEMPALGGPARKVVAQAGPFTVSGDNKIAFVRMVPQGQLGPMFLIPASGGVPQPWHPECRASSRPVWSTGGSELLFFGQCIGDQPGGHLAPRGGGRAVRVCDSSSRPVAGVNVGKLPVEGLFPTSTGILRIARGGNVSLTPSAVDQPGAVLGSGGTVLFSNLERANSIWSMAGRLEDARPQEIVTGIGHFAVSRDGSTLAYGRLVSQQGGELAVRNLRTGDERVFAAHERVNAAYGSIWPQVSPDGKQVYYRLAPGNQGGEAGHFILNLKTAEMKKVAGMEQFQLGSDWSANGKAVLGECATPRLGICDLDPTSGAVRKLFVHDIDQLVYPSESWDGRWMVFGRRKPGGIAGIWVARKTANGIETEEHWAEISPRGTDNSRPRFSPDDTFVYYMLGQGGMRRLAVQKIDPHTGAASGPPSLPLRRPIELTAVAPLNGYPLISVTANAIYYSANAPRGNIWLAHLQ
jgi:serine/threonine protein kinase